MNKAAITRPIIITEVFIVIFFEINKCIKSFTQCIKYNTEPIAGIDD